MIACGDIADPAAPGTFEMFIPIRTTTGLNSREHWAVKAKRVKRERKATRFFWMRNEVKLNLGEGMYWRIELARFSPGNPADTDNVVGGLKGVRDQIAVQLGINDGDRRHLWVYDSRKGPWGVRIRIRKVVAEIRKVVAS